MNYYFYDSQKHKRKLPVRVLPYNFLDWFENITPDFKEDVKNEINSYSLKVGILYNSPEESIKECAYINTNKQIELFENFNQYLCCICYSKLTCLYLPNF